MSSSPEEVNVVPTARDVSLVDLGRMAAWSGAVFGLGLGVLYSVGGLIVDLVTTGLNGGTALAFLALVGMPALAAGTCLVAAVVLGWLFNTVVRRLLPRMAVVLQPNQTAGESPSRLALAADGPPIAALIVLVVFFAVISAIPM